MSGAFTPDPSWPSILELATKLWGEPTDWSHDKNEAWFGKHQSKNIKIKERVWFDYEANQGGGYIEIHEAAIGPLPEPPPKTNGKANGHGGKLPPWENVGTVYPYLDASGTLVLEVIRTLNGVPRFTQRRPNGVTKIGTTKWRWSVKDIPAAERPLYRLPELLASGARTVFVVEGEKDCDRVRSLGLIATCPIGGAGKWRVEYVEALRDRHVVVLPDNDPQARGPHDEPLWHQDGRPILPGQDHAAVVAASLHGAAASVRVLMLPNLPVKGDVSDWLDAGGDRFELERLAREAPEYVPPSRSPPPPPPPPEDEGGEVEDEEPPDHDPPEVPPVGDPGGPGDALPPPVILCRAGELPRMVREAEKALLDGGAAIYQRGRLVQPVEEEYDATDGSKTHSAKLAPVTASALLKMLAEVAEFQKFDSRKNPPSWVVCDPPPKLVEIVLHDIRDWPFPIVRGVLTTPTLRPDGSILREPGYDPQSRYYLMFPEDFEIPEVLETEAAARESLERLDKLLDSYPFANKPSRSVALCMLMTQVLRCAMPTSPMLAVSARAAGTGKSHLVDLASTVAIGRLCPSMGVGTRNEEVEKEINTMLLSGVPGFSIDNVSRDLDIGTLNRATERALLTIRIFGVLESIEVENAVVIYQTGNNLAIVDEQGRRTLRCDLDAGVERPERREFTADPIYTVRANRPRYIADVLTIARAYHVSGERVAPFAIGSYGAWSHFVREPLIWLGRPDPVDTMETTAGDDPTTLRLTAIVLGWWHSFTSQPKTLAEAVVDAVPEFRDTMKEHFPARGGIDVDTTRMGYFLRKFSGRIVEGMRFDKDLDKSHSAIRWKLTRI